MENKDLTIKYGEQLKFLFMFFYFMGMVLHGKSVMSKIWMQWDAVGSSATEMGVYDDMMGPGTVMALYQL